VAASTLRFDRMVPATPDAVGALRRQLRSWVRRQGGSATLQANVALAFSEACTAIIAPHLHDGGEADADPGPLVLQAWVSGDELGVRVSHRSRDARASTGEVGYGFGLALIARLCERFEVRRRTGRPGTAMLMVFSLERAPAPARSSPRPPSRSSLRR
jgi:anti-sigma regulatory factor (Ser/Thr protein kinase)